MAKQFPRNAIFSESEGGYRGGVSGVRDGFKTLNTTAWLTSSSSTWIPTCPGPRLARTALEQLGNFSRILSNISSNLNKIFTNFCIQYSIFQHFSKSTYFCKILQNFAEILRISENFAKFCTICQKMSKFLQIFPTFWQKFPEFAREKVIFL